MTRPPRPTGGPGTACGRSTRPFLCAFSDADPITKGADAQFLAEVPGTRNQEHPTISGAGHFLQEDNGPALAAAVIDFVRANPAR